MQELLPAIHNIACWRHVCLPPRQRASTSCSWHSRAPALWDTPVHQSRRVASQQSWPQPGWLLHLGYDEEACRISSSSPRYGRVEAADCRDMRWISAEWWTMQLISGKKGWKRISVQNVVTLNTCCDAACLITTQSALFTATSATQQNSPFQSHQCLERNNIPSIRWMSSAFHKVVWWHFPGVMGKFTITVTVHFILR